MQELLFGRRYRATEKVGTGGMADVYRAVDEVLGRPVAVKVMHACFASDPEFTARFRQEAQAAANLVSPNIVNMYDWGQDGDTYYIVMELVRGSDLKMVERNGALPSIRVAEIGAQVCSALTVAHGYDVIHRDIKPHNIMVQPNGAVKVMDFGIARAGNSGLTQTGSVLGTAQYISPEQAQGKPLTAGSDLYSLGVVLYEAATGRLPFDADTPVAVALMQVNEQAASPRFVNPDIDPNLDAVIMKAMQKDPAHRYVSADDMRRDLRAVAPGSAAMGAIARTAIPAGAGEAATAVTHPDKTAVMPPVAKTAVSQPVGMADATARRKPTWLWMLLAALLVLAGLGAASNMGLIGPGRTTAIPNLNAKTRTSALTAIRDAGLTAGRVTTAFSARVKAGTVISQSPKSGVDARRGSAVGLVISKGPEKIAVPDVVGSAEADAFKALQDAGFSPQALPSEFNNDVPANTVLRQTPAARAEVAKGSIVDYVLSRGPEPFVPGWGGRSKHGKPKDGGDGQQ